MESIFSSLNAVDVSGKIEKKEGLSYLSWAWAWGELKKRYPLSYYTIYEAENGCIYHTDGRTCWVKTGVTVVDGEQSLEHIEYLPVMDARNKSIPFYAVTSFDVNKAIQRSLTKAVARHGLGLFVYAGEDLPEGMDYKPAKKVQQPKQVIRPQQPAKVQQVKPQQATRALNRRDVTNEFCTKHNITFADFCDMFRILKDQGKIADKKVDEMTVNEFQTMLLMMENSVKEKA